VLKKIASFFFLVLVLIAGGLTFAYYQYPEAKMEIKMFQKSLKIQAATEKLIADHACSDELKKADCFVNFVRVAGGVEFPSDLALFTIASYRICYKENSCMMKADGKFLSEVNLKNLWLFKEGKEDLVFFANTLKNEKKSMDQYFRAVRKSAVEKFQTEVDAAKKQEVLNYVKILDMKIVEVTQLQ